jgi:hypothetical protein
MNLVLNSYDAIEQNGIIAITTANADGGVFEWRSAITAPGSAPMI